MASQCHAQQMSTCISTMSSGGGDKVVGAGWGRAQGGKGSQRQLRGVICGVQGESVNTSLLQGPCSHCSAQGELWVVCHQSMGVHCAWPVKQAMHLLTAARALDLC